MTDIPGDDRLFASGVFQRAPNTWPSAIRWLSGGARDASKLFPREVYRLMRVDRRIGPHRIVVLNDPADIRRVLGAPSGYRLSNIQRRLLKPLLGDGITVAEGVDWRKQRTDAGRVAAGAHRRAALDDVDRLVSNALRSWTPQEPTPLLRSLKTLALDLIAALLFQTREPIATADVMEAVEAAETTLEAFDMLDALGAPAWAPSPKMLSARAHAHRFDHLVTDTLAAVQSEAHAPRLQHRDRRRQRDFVVSMLSGFESVALGSFWLLIELTRNRALAESLLRNGGPSEATMEPLIAETLRLYPSLPFVLRVAETTDASVSPKIPAGALVCISPWILHRHDAHWLRPDKFDPQRFAGGPASFPAYMPFGVGARRCVGRHISQRMISAIVRGVLTRWRVELCSGADVSPRLSVSLRPDQTVMARLIPRNVGGPRTAA